jgi:uncharacterized protein (TIGR03437 family)
VRELAVFVLIGACAYAQPGCPAVNFQAAVSANLKPSVSSHTTLVRQGDGSYTAYETADASPYRVDRTTPTFGNQLVGCLPKQPALPPLPPPQGAGSSPGAPSQLQAFARLASGVYLLVQSTGSSISATLFDSSLTLISETQYAVSAVQLKLVDLNGDANLDLIALKPGSPRTDAAIEVLLGNGGASFQPPIEHLLPGVRAPSTSVSTFSVGDLNGDGRPDLVLGIAGFGSGAGNLSYLAGNGDGTFRDESAVVSGATVSSTALADLNGDGKLDLVSAGRDQYSFPFVSVVLGAGDGSFGPPAKYPVAGNGSLAVGDVNGDGIPDIVSTGVSILFGDGKGAFPRRADYLSEAPGGIVLTDLDRDGRIDIVEGVTGNALIFTRTYILGGTSMSVLFGRGNGMFWGAPASIVPGLSAPNNFGLGVAAADFNHDGVADLAFSDLAGNITILQGSSAGSFNPIFQYQLANSLSGLPVAIVAADFNGDGRADLAVAVENYAPAKPNLVLVFVGKGDGTFQEPIAITLARGLSVSSLAAGDVNGDGKPDLAVVVNTQNGGTADEVLVFLASADGSFKSSASYAVGPVAFAVVTGDFNSDGRLDLAITNEGGYAQSDGTISLLFGKGDGTFSAAVPIPLSGAQGLGPYSIAGGDLNGDGKLDLVVTISNDTTYPGGLAVLLGRGDGSFQSPVLYPVTSAGVVVGDLNNDHVPDLIVSIPRSADAYPGAGYLLGNGDGTFAPEVQFAGLIGPLVTADFNRDGQLDLAGADQLFGVVSFLNASQPRPPFTVVSAASFALGPVAPDSLVSAFGMNLAVAAASAGAGPLPVTLSGTKVSVQDAARETLPASLLYVSPQQVNFLVPAGASSGSGSVTITSQSDTSTVSLSAPIEIRRVSPALFALNSDGLAAAYVVRVSRDGIQTIMPVFRMQNGAVVATPIDPGTDTDQVYLALFGTGIRNADALGVTVKIQGLNAMVTYTGPQGYVPGLDQVNVLLPRALAGSGSASIVLTADQITANTVHVSIR